MDNNNIIAHFTENQTENGIEMKMTTAKQVGGGVDSNWSQVGTNIENTNTGKVIVKNDLEVFDGLLKKIILQKNGTANALSFVKINSNSNEYLMGDGSISKRKIIQDNTLDEITTPTLYVEEVLSVMPIPANYFEENDCFEFLQSILDGVSANLYKVYITDDPNNPAFGSEFFYSQFNSYDITKIETKFFYRNGRFINLPNDMVVYTGYAYNTDVIFNANIPLYIVTTVECLNTPLPIQSNFKLLRKIN